MAERELGIGRDAVEEFVTAMETGDLDAVGEWAEKHGIEPARLALLVAMYVLLSNEERVTSLVDQLGLRTDEALALAAYLLSGVVNAAADPRGVLSEALLMVAMMLDDSGLRTRVAGFAKELLAEAVDEGGEG